MIPTGVMRLLSLDEIARRPEMLAGQPAKEIAETRIACAAVGAALDAAQSVAIGDGAGAARGSSATEPDWLSPAEAATRFNVRERRLRNNRPELQRLGFVRYQNRKDWQVHEARLHQWFEHGGKLQ
jgi:hypothetical protein